MNALLIISGPTATGKTDLALSLARIFSGEIINADSRQVYRGMDIGTGKDIPRNAKCKMQNAKLHVKNKKLTVGFREKEGIPIWLVDVVEPDYSFNISEYVRLAHRVIADICTRGKLPIVVGGTGFYIKALIHPPATLHIPTNEAVRKRLDKLSVEQLQNELARFDNDRLERMNASDKNNPRRLVRAIEITFQKGLTFSKKGQTLPVHRDAILTISLHASLAQLYHRIDTRVEARFREGVIDEIRSLLKKGYTWDLPAFSGCGYRVWQPFFEGKATEQEVLKRWKYQEHAYARRQLTWFRHSQTWQGRLTSRKQKDIRRFDITEEGYIQRIGETVREWYTQKRHIDARR